MLQESSGTGDPMTVTWTAAESDDYMIIINWGNNTDYQLEVEILD
jgi:hypothetical protein